MVTKIPDSFCSVPPHNVGLFNHFGMKWHPAFHPDNSFSGRMKSPVEQAARIAAISLFQFIHFVAIFIFD
jgi:hypothetical protein